MQLPVLHQALDGQDLAAIGLHGEHRARFHRLSIEHHRTRAAVAGIAANVSARQLQAFADEVDEQQPRLNHSLSLTCVDFHADQLFLRHSQLLASVSEPNLRIYLPARSAARVRARFANSLTSPFLYSAGPRKSELGCASSAANCAACRMLASSSFLPRRKPSAFLALMGVGPTLVNAMPTFCAEPLASTVTWAATAAVANSPTLRSSLRYAPPLRAGGTGTRISVRISPGCSAVLNNDKKKSSTGMILSPCAPVATTCAPSASMVAG